MADRDGRLALYRSDHLQTLWQRRNRPQDRNVSGREEATAGAGGPADRAGLILEFLHRNGASFFPGIHEAAGGGYPGETVEALWDLVWQGLVTNDVFGALRAFVDRGKRRRQTHGAHTAPYRPRLSGSPLAQGRWTLMESRLAAVSSPSSRSSTERATALSRGLRHRYGVLVREAAAAENVTGGFSAVYPVLKAMEESGRVRRGLFVAGLGATRFAEPAALELLRSLAPAPETPVAVELAAADPANPWGAVLPWPETEAALTRSAGASVILVNGALTAYLRSGNPDIQVFLPETEPASSQAARALANALRRRAEREHVLAAEERERGLERDHRRGLLISTVNGQAPSAYPLARFLEEAGFALGALGYHLPRREHASVEP